MSSDGTGLEEEVEDGGVSDNSKVSITGEFPIASGAKITIYIYCAFINIVAVFIFIFVLFADMILVHE